MTQFLHFFAIAFTGPIVILSFFFIITASQYKWKLNRTISGFLKHPYAFNVFSALFFSLFFSIPFAYWAVYGQSV